MLSKNSSLHRKAFTRSTRLKFNSKFSDMEQYFKKLTISFISLSFLIKRFPSLLNYQSYSAIWSSQYEPNLNNKNLSKFETSLRNPKSRRWQFPGIPDLRARPRPRFLRGCVRRFPARKHTESAWIAFTFAARPRSGVEKYRWIRYPVGQVAVASALILSSLCYRPFQVYPPARSRPRLRNPLEQPPISCDTFSPATPTFEGRRFRRRLEIYFTAADVAIVN